MAVDMFLKIEGVEGESADDKHKGEIDVLSFSWGMSQSGSMHIAGGGGSGKVNVQDMSVTKYLDKATTVLMQSCCLGKHFTKATLTCRKAGGKPVEYLIVTMEEVLVTNISLGGSEQDDLQTEMISLNFGKVLVKYTPQAADGAAGAESELGFDIRANKQP